VLSECCQSDSTLTAMAKIIGTLILSSKQKQITTKGTKKSRKTAHGVGSRSRAITGDCRHDKACADESQPIQSGETVAELTWFPFAYSVVKVLSLCWRSDSTAVGALLLIGKNRSERRFQGHDPSA